MNCKKNANSNLGEERQLFHPESEKVVEIGLERLRPFKNHPFKVKEDEAMAQLMESIERYGILNPLIVMPTREGVYQIVSGHRRKYCAEKLGYTQVPVIIRYMKEEDSIISMVDSNLHRDKILFSEKAFAYYMKNEAMKRKTGKRRRTQEGQLESIKGTKTIQLIGKETGESPRQVLRYIRLTLLVPELLDMLDEGKISFNPAVELSFLSEVEQKWVLNGMDYAQAAPSVSQAKRIKALSQEKKLTQQKINEILSEIKKSDMSRVIFKNNKSSTIEFGNELNQLSAKNNYRFKLFDVVAIPNGDKNKGKTDTISEDDLMDIIEEVMEKHSDKVKIWNISLGIPNKLCGKSMSDLGIFLDYIQDKYNVQIIVSAGNLEEIPLRTWPSQKDMKERDRIISPADSVRAITVGSVALYDSADSIVKENEPSPFSRRGPGSNYIVKPDLVDYGGNLSITYDQKNLAMRALSPEGKMIEGNGTSYSTPRITQKCAAVFDEMVDKDLLLAKALLVHSARMNSRDLLNDDLQENINYYGFGNPSINISDILHCSDHEMTLVFKQAIQQGTHLEMFDFPYPKSLITNGKCKGEICMTLVYSPILDQNYGKEYCRTNVDVSFGTYKVKDTGVLSYNGQVPLERAWDEKFEQSRVEHGFKWSPVKSYYRKISSRGIDVKDGWRIRIDMTRRNGLSVRQQEFVLVLTIRDITEQHDVYSDMVNGLKERSYITNNIETRHQIRQRQ